MGMEILVIAGFVIVILALLALDLGVFNRKAHIISTPEALAWTSLWVSVALCFNVGVYYMYETHWLDIGLYAQPQLSGRDAAMMFLTCYVVELSLSLDNIFVIALIFAYFAVPAQYQHRVLFWGILGALVMRGAMIGAGTALVQRFHWMIYVLALVLIWSAIKMLRSGEEAPEPERNPLIRLARRLYPVTTAFEGERFFTRLDGRRAITPLFLVLIMIESTDLLFAIDSIPAALAITTDGFIVFTSNVFAILGLRSLYFALAGLLGMFRYLKYSLVFVLMFVGVKMLITFWDVHIPIGASLGIIGGALLVGVLASLRAGPTARPATPIPFGEELAAAAAVTWHTARRVVILLLGSSVLLVGVAMIVLPGPALLVIPGGLAILATEFVWARRLLMRMKHTATAAAGKFVSRSAPSAGPERSHGPAAS
jgi:tellurite resistance protein TerC